MTAPMRSISSAVNLSPRAKLQGAHDGRTFVRTCGKSLSILSSPLGRSVVPQYTHGCAISSATSAVLKSQASTRWYALRRKIARPLLVAAYLRILALRFSLCSAFNIDHLSLRRSLPSFLARWHGRHSYAKPPNRDLSRKKCSAVNGSSCAHLWQRLMFMLPIVHDGPQSKESPA